MNQLLDADNQQEHKKNGNKDILFPKAVNSHCTRQNDKQILPGSNTRMKNSIHFVLFLLLR